MELPPFLLNEWLESRHGLRFNLAGSTGPQWTIEDVTRLGDSPLNLMNKPLSYAPPDGSVELREEIAAHHGVDPEWVVVTNGASEAFQLLLLALWRPGSRVLLPLPSYPAFTGAALSAQVEPHYYELSRDRGFRIDLDEITTSADDRTLLVVTNSPQNPTGSILSAGDCEKLAQRLAEKEVPLLVDEVFHPVYHGDRNPTAASTDNVITIGDMSKAFSMPGLRVGWIVDADAGRRSRIIRARSYLSLSGSPVSEAVALHALRNRSVVLQRVNKVAAANLKDLKQFMVEAKDVLDWVPPEAGMLAFPWFRDGRNSRAFCECLAERDVFLAPGDCFGMDDHIRVGFGSQPEGIKPALNIMRKELGIG